MRIIDIGLKTVLKDEGSPPFKIVVYISELHASKNFQNSRFDLVSETMKCSRKAKSQSINIYGIHSTSVLNSYSGTEKVGPTRKHFNNQSQKGGSSQYERVCIFLHEWFQFPRLYKNGSYL